MNVVSIPFCDHLLFFAGNWATCVSVNSTCAIDWQSLFTVNRIEMCVQRRQRPAHESLMCHDLYPKWWPSPEVNASYNVILLVPDSYASDYICWRERIYATDETRCARQCLGRRNGVTRFRITWHLENQRCVMTAYITYTHVHIHTSIHVH